MQWYCLAAPTQGPKFCSCFRILWARTIPCALLSPGEGGSLFLKLWPHLYSWVRNPYEGIHSPACGTRHYELTEDGSCRALPSKFCNLKLDLAFPQQATLQFCSENQLPMKWQKLKQKEHSPATPMKARSSRHFMVLIQPQAQRGWLDVGAARNTFLGMALSLVQGFLQTKSTQWKIWRSKCGH